MSLKADGTFAAVRRDVALRGQWRFYDRLVSAMVAVPRRPSEGADPSNEQPEQKGIGRIVIVDGRIMFGSCLELDESVHGGPYGPCDEVRVIPPDLSRGLPVAHQLGHGGEACLEASPACHRHNRA